VLFAAVAVADVAALVAAFAADAFTVLETVACVLLVTPRLTCANVAVVAKNAATRKRVCLIVFIKLFFIKGLCNHRREFCAMV
jgi:hypothetical protein